MIENVDDLIKELQKYPGDFLVGVEHNGDETEIDEISPDTVGKTVVIYTTGWRHQP